MKFSISESTQALDPETLETFNANFEKLKICANEQEFQLRDDSKLVWNFCLGKISWQPQHVIDELIGINNLYQNTNYAQNLEIGLPILANELKRRYNTHWDVLWLFVREWGSEAIKIETMRRNNMQFKS